jgi:peptidoglycan/LPS O-acetylase OafA/YrhL
VRPEAFYRPSLDGLRFFAFFGVFLHHSLPHEVEFYVQRGFGRPLAELLGAISNAGAFGVDLFFVLSAYLITELLLRERDARQTIDLKAFYIRRALRIWPLHYVFLGLALVLTFLVPTEQLSWQQALAFALFSGNWPYVFMTAPRTVAVLLWTVSVEEQFYLMWPLVVRRATKHAIVVVSVCMIVVALCLRAVLAHADRDMIWNNTLARLDPFAAGAILAVALKGGALRSGPKLRWGLVVLGIAGLILGTRLSGVLVFPGNILGKILGYSLVACCCVLIFLGTLRIPDPKRQAFLERPLLVYLGRISYGLYVYHLFALLCGELLVRSMPAGVMRVALSRCIAFPLTVVLAMASYRWLEKPFLRFKQRFTVIESRPGG